MKISEFTQLDNGLTKLVKDDPVDRLEIELGDVKQVEFYSQLKIMRWDNEVNASFRLVDDEVRSPVTTSDKTTLDGLKRKVELYEIQPSEEHPEGGFEFEITLKEKPLTNKVEFTMQTKGLDFFYQPKLTVKETADGCFRPENIEGSYAIYHSGNPINHVGGELYGSGKFGHIPKPKVFDATGNWVWGELNIGTNLMTVTIPQDFLDNAVYPVRHAAGATFGYDTIGGSQFTQNGTVVGSKYTGAAGTVTAITLGRKAYPGTGTTRCAIYDSSYNLITNGASDTEAVDNPSGTSTVEFTFTSDPTVSAVDYWLVQAPTNTSSSGTTGIAYDSGATDQGLRDTGAGNDPPPSTLVPSTLEDRKYSIYATYTAGGGDGTATPSVGSLTLSTPGVVATGTRNPTVNANAQVLTLSSPGVTADGGGGSSWDIAYEWDTGDINSRVTSATKVINDAGTPYIIAPVQHGVKAFTAEGVLEWTYTGIINGYDVRDLAVGDLDASGYDDNVVIASGYYTSATDGNIAILDKDGNEIDEILGSAFTTTPGGCNGVALDGTDIYVSSTVGLNKFSKVEGAWVEQWEKAIGNCYQVTVDDMGNGTRIYVAQASSSQGVYCYQPDGTLDWSTITNNQYTRVFAIGKSDSTKTGLQMAVGYQGGIRIVDKDGNLSQALTTPGASVREGIVFYDCDGDGEDEIYYVDYAQDVYCVERTGTNTYSQKYSLLNSFTGHAGIAAFDITDDGSKEIFIFGTDDHCRIYDKTLATELKDLNIAHGDAGGYYSGYTNRANGIAFHDTSGDGNEDLIISGASGYVDVFEASGFSAGSTDDSVSIGVQALTLSTPGVTASGTRNASIAVGVLSLILSAVAVVASGTSDGNISINTQELSLTSNSVVATGIRSPSVDINTLDLTLSTPGTVASGIRSPTVNISPLELTLSSPGVTATAQDNETISVGPLVLSLTTNSVTATGTRSPTVSVGPLSLTLTSPGVTATAEDHETIGIGPLELTLSTPGVTATGIRSPTVNISPQVLTLSTPGVTASAVISASAVYWDGSNFTKATFTAQTDGQTVQGVAKKWNGSEWELIS